MRAGLGGCDGPDSPAGAPRAGHQRAGEPIHWMAADSPLAPICLTGRFAEKDPGWPRWPRWSRYASGAPRAGRQRAEGSIRRMSADSLGGCFAGRADSPMGVIPWAGRLAKEDRFAGRTPIRPKRMIRRDGPLGRMGADPVEGDECQNRPIRRDGAIRERVAMRQAGTVPVRAGSS